MGEGGGTAFAVTDPSGVMAICCRESGLTVREALLTMLISYLETIGFREA